MKKITDKNHYSPVLANKPWISDGSEGKYAYYYHCPHRQKVVKSPKGIGTSAWGYELNLYSQAIEDAFDKEIENESALLYNKLIEGIELSSDERVKWGRFIVTQAIRVPSFIRYREKAAELTDNDVSFKEKLIGHHDDPDNYYVALRDWIILEADKDDYFLRTDNPVYMTGFIECPLTVILYPLSPKKCFVACSFVECIPLINGEDPPKPKQEFLKLEKGDAWHINFELARSASRSLILSKTDDCSVSEKLCLDILGRYPQIPFLMGSAKSELESLHKQDELTYIMSLSDRRNYPYRKYPFAPFYGLEFSMGINPFSIFGVTDDALRSEIDRG